MIKIYRIGFKETHEEGYHYIGRKRSVSILPRELKMYELYKEYVGKDFHTYINLKEEVAPVSNDIVKAFNSVEFTVDKHEIHLREELKIGLAELFSHRNDMRVRELWWLIQEMFRNIDQGSIYLRERGE